MSTLVCVQCNNINTVNSTDNRLVTESCGHVKCMQCLLREKSGCTACSQQRTVDGIDDTEDVHDLLLPVKFMIGRSEKITERNHIIANEDEKGHFYLCTKCNKKCRNRWQLSYHSYCNGQTKPFRCPLPSCGKSFVTASHFKYHVKVHRNDRNYSCDICGSSFVAKSKLKRHMLRHTQDKKFICSVGQCKKAFNNVSSLRQHQLIHTQQKPRECAVCGARFRDRSNYYKHVARHDSKKRSTDKDNPDKTKDKKKKFQCTRCVETFQTAKDLRRHSTVHIDSRPFRCKVCTNKSFSRKDNLERHIRNSHPQFVTSAVIEVDEVALAERSTLAHKSAADAKGICINTEKEQESKEKIILETLNPLPPLSKEIIDKHIGQPENVPDETTEPLSLTTEKTKEAEKIDKAYILEANNARESVIFVAKSQKVIEEMKDFGYVHKIRKANSMANRKDIQLPPIDESKIVELEEKTTTNNLDVGSPPKNVDLYRRILYDKPYKKAIKLDNRGMENSELYSKITSSPKHWRRKLKLNVKSWTND